MTRSLGMLAALALIPTLAHAGALSGVIWATRAEANRATAAQQSRLEDGLEGSSLGWLTGHFRPVSGRPDPSLEPVHSHPALREAVVYVQAVPERVEAVLAMRARKQSRATPIVVQTSLRFTPRVTAVPRGSDVEFLNHDGVWHNTFSRSHTRTFDLGKYPPERGGTVRFDRTGVVNVFCDIHSQESGYVLVVPNHAYARPDSLGRFELPKLPPGAYTLRLWHPRLGEISRAIEMPKHGNLHVHLAF